MNHFTEDEFRCGCGLCDKGYDDMSNSLLGKLDTAREEAATSFVLNSAIRCPAHNAEVGGVDTSSHLTGEAVDIEANNGPKRIKIVAGLIKAGFRRIGIAKSFIHTDDDKTKAASLWIY